MDSEFRKNFLALFSGTSLAQVIPFLFAPLLSRVFSAEDFAVYGLYIAILEVIAIIIAGRYELTIVLPRKKNDAVRLVQGALLIAFVFSFLLLLIVSFLNMQIADLLNNPALAPFLYLLPLSLFFYAVTRVLNNFLIRNKKFKAIAKYKLSHKTGEAISALGLGYIKFSNGLIWGDVFGRFLLSGLSLYSAIKTGLKEVVFSWKDVKKQLYHYKEFPLYNSLPAVANSMATLLPVFLISRFYDEELLGNFNFARMIMVAPIALISAAVSQILSQKLAQLYNENKSIWTFLKPIGLSLLGLAVLIIVVLFPFAEILFEFVFGDKWETAGKISSILVFAFALQFILTALYPVFYILNSIKISSAWQIFYFCTISLLIFAGSMDFYVFIKSFVVLNLFCFAIYGLLIYKVIHKYEKGLEHGK
jgi:O-antigen/teichoic acid export membrane protein